MTIDYFCFFSLLFPSNIIVASTAIIALRDLTHSCADDSGNIDRVAIVYDILKIPKKRDARSYIEKHGRKGKGRNKGRVQDNIGETWSKDEIYSSCARVFLSDPSSLSSPLRSLIHQSLNISKQRPAQRFPSLTSFHSRDARTSLWAHVVLFKSLKHQSGVAASTQPRVKFLDFAEGDIRARRPLPLLLSTPNDKNEDDDGSGGHEVMSRVDFVRRGKGNLAGHLIPQFSSCRYPLAPLEIQISRFTRPNGILPFSRERAPAQVRAAVVGVEIDSFRVSRKEGRMGRRMVCSRIRR